MAVGNVHKGLNVAQRGIPYYVIVSYWSTTCGCGFLSLHFYYMQKALSAPQPRYRRRRLRRPLAVGGSSLKNRSCGVCWSAFPCSFMQVPPPDDCNK